MPKRKANELENGVTKDEPRRSGRRKPAAEPKVELPPKSKKPPTGRAKKASAPVSPKQDPEPVVVNGTAHASDDEDEKQSKSSRPKAAPKKAAAPPERPPGRQYWLMKAEPESRLEKGVDVKFSIDDLAAKTKPEPWDGIRNHQAKNNLRAMKKGDLAFFYHSSCKVPAIAGIMEIVEEHSPDMSAHDPAAPYHDPTSTPENPKWSVVHVEFRQKLATPITLKELREWKTGPLKDMQMLNAGRLSVSRVRKEEWEFLLGQMKERATLLSCEGG